MNKNIIFSVLVILAFLLSVSSAFAIVPSLITPAASATISGEASLNTTCSDCTAVDLFNVTYSIIGTSGMNTSSVTLKIRSNVNFTSSANATGEHFKTSNYMDASYTVTSTLTNLTSSLSSATTSTGVKINNAVPTAPTACTANNFQNLTYMIQCTVVPGDTTNLTLTWINGAPVTPTPTLIFANTNTAYAVINNGGVGTYAYYMSSTDDVDTTTGPVTYISARRPAGASGVDSGVEGAGGSPSLAFMQSKLPASFSEAVNVESVKGAAVGGAIGAALGFVAPIPGGTILGGLLGAFLGGWLW